MLLKKVLENEAALTKPIRDEVAAFGKKAHEYLNELMVPWEGDLEEDEEDKEEE